MSVAVTGVARVLEREAYVFKRIWRLTTFSTFVSPLLFLTGLGVGLGGLVDERSSGVEGLSYLDFVTPGLLAASAMQVGAFSSLWPVMAGTTWTRFFHGIVATPISAAELYGGFVAWVAVRGAMASTVFLAVAVLLGGVPSWWAVLAFPAAVLTTLAFICPMAAYSATQETDQSFPVIIRLAIVPLYLFSETFFPLEQLPSWVRPLAWASPLWHGVELCRAATTGGGLGLGRTAVHVAVLLGVIAAGAAWGTRTFARKLTG